ncbi:MAG TPA: hypothetical protein P5572_14510, partial [Phycisphaerae bacterium]|nr:hypothetical protein [Phycisphaerae bacterium]
MSTHAPSTSPGTPIVLIDTCQHCGYSLRGHPDQGRCSECGCAYDKVAGAWRKDGKLIVLKRLVLPRRCVKCDSKEGVKINKCTMSWHHPAFYLFLLLTPLVYIVVGMIVQRSGVVHVGLCARHHERHMLALLTTWAAALSAIASLVL